MGLVGHWTRIKSNFSVTQELLTLACFTFPCVLFIDGIGVVRLGLRHVVKNISTCDEGPVGRIINSSRNTLKKQIYYRHYIS